MWHMYLFIGTGSQPEQCPTCGRTGEPLAFELHPPDPTSERLPVYHRCADMVCQTYWPAPPPEVCGT